MKNLASINLDKFSFLVQAINFDVILFSDVIFFIFLYQRYIYKIDPKRVNEYGTSQEMFENDDNTVEGEDGNQAIQDSDKTSETVEEEPAPPKSKEEKKND